MTDDKEIRRRKFVEKKAFKVKERINKLIRKTKSSKLPRNDVRYDDGEETF